MLAFVIGFVFMVVIGVQTRLMASNKSPAIIFTWVTLGGLVYSLVIQLLVLGGWNVLWYALGNGLGAALSSLLKSRWF